MKAHVAKTSAAATLCCPVEGCQMLRHSHHLVCIAHWRKLPKAQQRGVARAWETYRNCTDRDERMALYQVWRKAAAGAIAWLGNHRAGAA